MVRRRRATILLLAAAERLYGALLVLYPQAFRRRYAPEMRRDFRELSWEGLDEGSGTRLARVWTAAFSDLVLTALEERGTMLARNGYLPVAPHRAARWGALCALAGGFMGMTYSVAYTLAINNGTSERPAWWDSHPTWLIGVVAMLLSVLGMFGLYGTLVARSGRPDRLALAGVALVAPSVASMLALRAWNIAMMIGWLVPPGDPGESFYWWFYANRILELFGMGSCVVGLSLLGASAFRTRLFGPLSVLPFVVAALWPASVALFFLAAVSGMYHLAPLSGILPFLGAALSGWVLLNINTQLAPAGDASSGVPEGTRGTARRARRALRPSTSSGWMGRQQSPAAEAAKEKELLEALGRRGALTVAGAALETSLSVEEADRMLSALAAKGHLEVSVDHGRLVYALWERDAPR